MFVSDCKANELSTCNAFPGDIIFAKMMPAGRACILPDIYKRYLLGSDAIRCILDNHKVDTIFFLEAVNRKSFRNLVDSKTAGSTRKRIGLPELKNLPLLIPEKKEQEKIGNLFRLIEEKGNILNSKISTLKKYKKGLLQKGIKQILSSSHFLPFSDLFKKEKIKNSQNFSQYTVGKDGLKKLEESDYDLSNHLIFESGYLLIGVGIDEIVISENTIGCVSPVYNVYKILDRSYLPYCKYFLKPILWRKKAFITRKSTRREYEVDTTAVENIHLPIVHSPAFGLLCKSLDMVEMKLFLEEKLKEKLIIQKKYLLADMFI